jgi:hypothetical protein
MQTESLTVQVPKARLVARRWLVCATHELEGQHGRHGRCSARHHSHGLDRERAERISRQDAAAEQVLPQSIVRKPPEEHSPHGRN